MVLLAVSIASSCGWRVLCHELIFVICICKKTFLLWASLWKNIAVLLSILNSFLICVLTDSQVGAFGWSYNILGSSVTRALTVDADVLWSVGRLTEGDGNGVLIWFCVHGAPVHNFTVTGFVFEELFFEFAFRKWIFRVAGGVYSLCRPMTLEKIHGLICKRVWVWMSVQRMLCVLARTIIFVCPRARNILIVIVSKVILCDWSLGSNCILQVIHHLILRSWLDFEGRDATLLLYKRGTEVLVFLL